MIYKGITVIATDDQDVQIAYQGQTYIAASGLNGGKVHYGWKHKHGGIGLFCDGTGRRKAKQLDAGKFNFKSLCRICFPDYAK